MRREAEKGDARDPQDELLAPIGAAHLRIETEAVVNEISAAHGSKKHEQSCGCPCEKQWRHKLQQCQGPGSYWFAFGEGQLSLAIAIASPD
jgi:hypothetical protein